MQQEQNFPKTWLDTLIILRDVEVPPYRFRLGCMDCVRKGFADQEIFTSNKRLSLFITEANHPKRPHHKHQWFLQAALWREDVDTGEWGYGYGGKYLLSPWMTEGEIVKKCLVAALSYAEHEVREAFEYKGKRIFGPHVSIRALLSIAGHLEVRPNEHVAKVKNS